MSSHDLISPEAADFYRDVLVRLSDSGVPFLVGGAFAFAQYTGIRRHTKDVDLFVIERNLEAALSALETPGCRAERTSAHWLAKVRCGERFVDLVYATGNGVATVDDGWFERARRTEVLGIPVLICSPEDIIWSKALIQERERFDGADVAHLILRTDIDWDMLLGLFGPHWRVLLAHLILFGFSYPSRRDRIPRLVMEELMERLEDQLAAPAASEEVCFGTLLSRSQYLVDVREWGFKDGRIQPEIGLSREDVAAWTEAAEHDQEQGA